MRKIRDLPANEHPREKLLEKGDRAPANHELLAIILGKDSQKNE